MGWLGIENDGKRRNAHEHIARGIGSETLLRTLAAERVGDTIYFAYWGEDDKVIGVVLLLEQSRGWTHYKIVDEGMGPAEAECPAVILNLLDETDVEYALAWRKRCQANLARLAG